MMTILSLLNGLLQLILKAIPNPFQKAAEAQAKNSAAETKADQTHKVDDLDSLP